MQQIKNIIFDFGGVLVDWNPRYLYRDLFDSEEEMEYFLTKVCHNDWNEGQDKGKPLEQATQEKIAEFPDYEYFIKKYYDEWETMLHSDIYNNTFWVKHLKEKGFRVFGLTNWSAETFPIAYKRYSVFHEFEDIVVSGEVKLKKPDEKIYTLALSTFGIKAEESLFIDDNLKNIEAAEKLGIHTIHLTAEKSLENELRMLDLI